MDDRQFWIAIRAALLAIVSAIEKRWQIGPRAQLAPFQDVEADNFGG